MRGREIARGVHSSNVGTHYGTKKYSDCVSTEDYAQVESGKRWDGDESQVMGIVEVMDKTRKIDDGKGEGMRRERK